MKWGICRAKPPSLRAYLSSTMPHSNMAGVGCLACCTMATAGEVQNKKWNNRRCPTFFVSHFPGSYFLLSCLFRPLGIFLCAMACGIMAPFQNIQHDSRLYTTKQRFELLNARFYEGGTLYVSTPDSQGCFFTPLYEIAHHSDLLLPGHDVITCRGHSPQSHILVPRLWLVCEIGRPLGGKEEG